MTFASLHLMPQLLQAVTKSGYASPTPIQAATIPLVLAGKDVLGCAQTGTGKTAAFALPILQNLSRRPVRPGAPRPIRALILTPTRSWPSRFRTTLWPMASNWPCSPACFSAA